MGLIGALASTQLRSRRRNRSRCRLSVSSAVSFSRSNRCDGPMQIIVSIEISVMVSVLMVNIYNRIILINWSLIVILTISQNPCYFSMKHYLWFELSTLSPPAEWLRRPITTIGRTHSSAGEPHWEIERGVVQESPATTGYGWSINSWIRLDLPLHVDSCWLLGASTSIHPHAP